MNRPRFDEKYKGLFRRKTIAGVYEDDRGMDFFDEPVTDRSHDEVSEDTYARGQSDGTKERQLKT